MVSSLLILVAVIGCGHGLPTPDTPAARSTSPTQGLRGTEALLGNVADPKLTTEDTHVAYSPVPGQTDDANLGTYLNFENVANPQPVRGTKGGTDPGPRNSVYDQINSDKLAPPGTDHGQTINAQWPMGLSHAKLGLSSAGWSRQENTQVMPDATKMAGVDMRLEAGAYRELHWHVAGEWALMLNGTARISAIDENGHSFIDDVSKGDVWFFPPGVPHSIQALEGGCEFMLVFDDGTFSEDNTFLVSEIMAHNPLSVLSKNLDVPVSAFKDIPAGELFIFPGTAAPKDISKQNITSSVGYLPKAQAYSYHWSEQTPMTVAGGSVKVLDPVTFPIAKNFAAALVTIKPGAMREIHWHPSSDEWSFIISGKGRATLFTPPKTATTFDYRAGDVAYFPKSNSHYIENVGNDDLVFLEVLQADHFADISLGQWLALTPPQVVMDTLHLSAETVAKFKKEKQYIVSGKPVSNGTASS